MSKTKFDMFKMVCYVWNFIIIDAKIGFWFPSSKNVFTLKDDFSR